MEDLFLIYGEKINEFPNSDGLFEYDFYFSKNPEIAWGVDWNQNCPSACSRENMRPDASTYDIIKRLKTTIPLSFACENSCFSMQDCIDGIVGCIWENINGYDTFPEPFRLVFRFGEYIEDVIEDLKQRDCYFENEKPSE